MDNNEYIKYALSATRAKIAYMKSSEVHTLWLQSEKDTSHISYYIFDRVQNSPRYFFDEDTRTNGYSWTQDKVLYIIFRGTSDREDIIIDLDTDSKPLFLDRTDILVHGGFLKQLLSICDIILGEININFDFIDTIHFSGHSLGAGVATLAAAYTASILSTNERKKKIVCHTFGSSRVGNYKFCQYFNAIVDETVRIVNFKDPIPLVPVSCRFYHVANEICIDDECIATDRPWFLRLLCIPFAIDCCQPIAYHTCNMYIDRLLKLGEFNVVPLP